jgi:tetratricopeptide (TPR) repeat protein
MNNWQDVWNRLSDGKHVVLRGAGPIPQPNPARLRLFWVDCEDFPEPCGTLDEARRSIDRVLGIRPIVDGATRRLRAGLRRHLLGEDQDEVELGRYEDAFHRSAASTVPPAALLLSGVDRADRRSIERLTRLFAGEYPPTWPMLIRFDAREPTGPAKSLLEQLERVLPPEAFWEEPTSQAPGEGRGAPSEVLPTLSQDALRIVRAAATIGDRFEIETLAALLELDAITVLAGVQEAVDRGLSIEDRGQGVFRLDAAAGAALRASTLQSLALAWHERLAGLYGGLPAPAPRPSSNGKLSPVTPPDSVEAPQAAVQVGASRAPDGDLSLSSRSPALRGAGDDSTGGPQGLDGASDSVERLEQRAALHAEAAGLWESACEQHLAAAERSALLGEHAQSLESSSQALALIDRVANLDRRRVLRARALLAVGHSRWRSHGSAVAPLDLALEALEQAREHLKDDDSPVLTADVASMMANVCYDIGTPRALERALVELMRASQILLDGGRPIDAARLLNDQAALWVRMGNPVRAHQLLSRSLDVFGKMAESNPAARLELLETEHILARLALHAPPLVGHEQESMQIAFEHARVAEKGYRELGDQRQRGRVLETLGRLMLRLGRLDEAAQWLEDAQRLQRQIGDEIGLARSSGARSEVFCATRDYSRALDSLAASIAINMEKRSAAGLQFNLAMLRQIEEQLPPKLLEWARMLGQGVVVALTGDEPSPSTVSGHARQTEGGAST